MKRAREYPLLTAGAVILCLSGAVFAMRLAPKAVAPVRCKGIEYRAPQGLMGCVEAWDVQTNVRIWWKQIYVVRYNPKLETDVQDVYICKMKLDKKKNALLIENEKGEKYSLDLASLKVERKIL